MESILDPGFVYEDIECDITENDLDIVSELWDMDGREVYRGTRDPRYTHANVFWLYDETLARVGLVEHSKLDHAVFHILWYYDSDFATLVQEEGWKIAQDLWSTIPRTVFDRFVNEGWTTAQAFLEQCLHGPMRIIIIDTMLKRPSVYTCSKCGRKSLKEQKGCVMTAAPLDFPKKEKVFFVDDDLIVNVPPLNTCLWARLGFMQDLQPRDDGSLLLQESVQLPESALQTEPTLPPLVGESAPLP
jgi:hypothetical protein